MEKQLAMKESGKIKEKKYLPEEEDENNPEAWVKALSSYFSGNGLQDFLKKENCARQLLGTVRGENLAAEIVEKISLFQPEESRPFLPSFRIIYKKVEGTGKKRKALFGGGIKERSLVPDSYDILVEKI
ncbi:MAG: hypothetical protein PHI66_03970 [Candidatus Pacebacteria bacterium]|nr:hypothetical protein [Candidatus Paceibacterota bacterium]